MKIDLNQVIADVWGKPVVEVAAKTDKDGKILEPAVELTLGHAVANAYLTPVRGDENEVEVAAKVKTFRAAKIFADGGVVDLSIEDISDARKRVAKVYHAVLAGPVLELLDVGDGEKPKAAKAA